MMLNHVVVACLSSFSLIHSVRVRVGGSTPEVPAQGYQTTLRDWLKKGDFHLALVPQFNNQYSVFGILEALREENLIKGLTGISSVSGTTLPASFMASGTPYSKFKEMFPANGWGGIGPAEPKIESDYRQFLKSSVPETFEALQVPTAVSLTSWDSIKDLRQMNVKNAKPLIMTSGNLHDAMLAAVSSGTNNQFSDVFCPYCLFGFHPKKIEGKYPVTDGGPTDPWGVKGLAALPTKSSRLLHILSLDYPEQWKPLRPQQVPSNPKEMVTVTAVQTPTATHSFLLDNFQQRHITLRSAEAWNELMYTSSFNEMKRKLGEPIEMKPSSASLHGVLNTDATSAYQETPSEQWYDKLSAAQRDAFWKKVAPEGGHGNPYHEDMDDFKVQ